MMDKINEYVLENFGMIGILAWVVTTGIIYLSVCCTKMFMSIRRIDELPCAKHEGDIVEMKSAQARLEEKTEKVNTLPCAKHEGDIVEIKSAQARLEEKTEKVNTLPCTKHEGDIVDLKLVAAKLQETMDRMDRRMAELTCRGHQDKLEEHSCSIVKINTSLEYIKSALDAALGSQSKMPGFTQTRSPLAITEVGMAMVKRLGLDVMFEKNWPRIDRMIEEGVENKTPYDIDRFCRDHAVVFPERFLGEDEINVLKNDAYMQGLSITHYMNVVAVMARDRYFKEHGIEPFSPNNFSGTAK